MAENNLITVEEFARALVDYANAKDKSWEGALRHMGEAYKYYVNDVKPSSFNPDDENTWPESFKLIVDKLKIMGRESREEQDLLRISTMFRNIINGIPYYEKRSDFLKSVTDLLLALRKFKDQNLVYIVLKKIGYDHAISEPDKRSMHKELSKQYYDMVGSNKNATATDICERMYYCKNADEARDIVNGVFNKVEADVKAELSRDFPDKSKITASTNVADRVVRVLGDMAIRWGDTDLQKSFGDDRDALRNFEKEVYGLEAQVKEKFNADKLYEENNPLVIQKFDENLSVQFAEVKAKNDELTAANSGLVETNRQLRENKKTAEEQKKKLEQKYNDERVARLSVEKMLQKALDVIAAYEKGEADVDKAGVFNKGAAKVKMKKQVEDAQDELKRAEAEEAKRVVDLMARQKANGEAISI